MYQKAEQCYDEDGIPLTYTKLEYLESTGTQYIDTGIVPTKNTTVDMIFRYRNNQGSGINGVRQTSDYITRFYPVATINDSQFRCVFGNEVYYFDNILSKHHIIFNDENHHLYVDGNLEQTFNVNNINLDGNKTIWIFSGNSENPSSNRWFSSEIIYSFKIYDEGTIIRDYIPVLDKNNRPCLFDKVSKTCFYNQGIGEFIYKDKNFEGCDNCTKLNYLESTGTQYINTGIISSSGVWDISTKFKARNIANQGSLFGSTNGFNISIDSSGYKATAQVISQVRPSVDDFDDLKLHIETVNNTIQLNINNNLFTGTYQNWKYGNTIGIYGWGNRQQLLPGLYKKIVFSHDGVVVGDFIPVLDPKDRPCLFDKVSKTCFYNQGTGEFLYG